MTLLQVRGLSKRFAGAAAPVIDGLDLDLPRGGYLAITGRSGSGKSTLLAMLGGLARPSAGQVLLDGRDIWAGLDDAERATLRRSRIATVTQQAGLLPTLRAADNVALPALLGGAPPRRADAEARAMLARVGLAHRMDAYPGELSGGEQRRVTIARALAGTPQVLLADEPTGDLDGETEVAIIDLIEALRAERGFAVGLVTHNPALAARAAQRLVIEPALPPPVGSPAALSPPLGSGLRRRAFAVAVATLGLAGLAAAAEDVAAARREEAARHRRAEATDLARRARSALRSEIASVDALGGGRYEVGLALENRAADGRPLFLLEPRLQAFVQEGLEWRPLPLRPLEEATALVRELPPGRQVLRYALEARPERFTPLLKHYMHVRFRQDMQVGLADRPGAAVAPVARTDDHFIHLKPQGVEDATILRDVSFPGPPPLWIWMPPH